MDIMIRKYSGESEQFNPQKVIEALMRSGADRKIADDIVKEIEGKLYDGITTKEIYGLSFDLLKKTEPVSATKFGLKTALMRLGPSGFPFEKYFAAILTEHGYNVKLNQKIKGLCVEHEIDLVVEDSLGTSIVECKYHNTRGMYTGLKEALYTHARLLDLNDAGLNFDSVWLVSNTKCSSEAKKYAKCRNMKVIGWNYPPGKSLQNMIEEKGLYPITILRSVDKKTKDALARANYMTVRDLVNYDQQELSEKTGLNKSKVDKILEEVKALCLC